MTLDFVARAGALLDKSHRITGVLLTIVIFQLLVILWLVSSNGKMVAFVSNMRASLPVYVVPGSTAQIYRPESSDTLLVAFIDFITQSLYTFTYESYQGQYDEVKKFFTPEMLRFADDFFLKKIEDSKQIRASELFIPNRQSMQIERYIVGGEQLTDVKIRGSIQQIVNANVIQTRPVEFTLTLTSVLNSRANPFGFMVRKLLLKELKE